MTAQHTPIPWRVGDEALKTGEPINATGPAVYLFANGPLSDKYAPALVIAAERTVEAAQANAAFIVRAVNAHETMLEALADLVERTTNLRIALEPWPKTDEASVLFPRLRESLDKARRALAQAEEKT